MELVLLGVCLNLSHLGACANTKVDTIRNGIFLFGPDFETTHQTLFGFVHVVW